MSAASTIDFQDFTRIRYSKLILNHKIHIVLVIDPLCLDLKIRGVGSQIRPVVHVDAMLLMRVRAQKVVAAGNQPWNQIHCFCRTGILQNPFHELAC